MKRTGLPPRWRFRYGKYRYRPRKDERPYFDNQNEFTLGATLSEAYTEFGRRRSMMDGDFSVRTMKEVIDRYWSEVTPKKALRTQRDEPAKLETLRNVFGNELAKDIKPEHIYKIYDVMKRKRGHTTADRHMELLSHIFTYSIRYGARTDHPMTNKRFTKDKRRETEKRYIEDWELEAALTVASPLITGYVRLKWLTGLRQTDLLALKESQINDGVIFVQPSKTAKHNNPGINIVISPEIQEVLDYIRRNKKISSIYLFSTRRGQSYLKADKTCNGFQSIWRRWINKALEETDLQERFSERAIRTKTATDMPSIQSAQALLGHSTETTTRRHYRQKPETVVSLIRKKKT